MNEEVVDVYVGGDGGCWSCSPAILFRIPTDIFDLSMVMGRLNSIEDLEVLMEEIRENNIQVDDVDTTDVWVSRGGTWSGLPSNHFKIPVDVFNFLVGYGDESESDKATMKDTESTIGSLFTKEDLDCLIKKTRYEIIHGPICRATYHGTRTKPPNNEMKNCGHPCSTSSVKEGCCLCMDNRPMRPEGTYPNYIDGKGWVYESNRNAGYCQFCI